MADILPPIARVMLRWSARDLCNETVKGGGDHQSGQAHFMTSIDCNFSLSQSLLTRYDRDLEVIWAGTGSGQCSSSYTTTDGDLTATLATRSRQGTPASWASQLRMSIPADNKADTGWTISVAYPGTTTQTDVPPEDSDLALEDVSAPSIPSLGHVLSCTAPSLAYVGQPPPYGELEYQVDAELGKFLWFDGVNMNLVDPKQTANPFIAVWPAFSGIAGVSMSDANQRLGSKGALPEGLYLMAPADTLSQKKADNAWDWIKWTLKSSAWGIYATPLHPLGDTETWGRYGFTVHGGARAGSIGCIDLVQNNERFHSWLGTPRTVWRDGKQVTEAMNRPIVANYVELAKDNPRTHSTPDHCPDDGNRFCTESSLCRYNKLFTVNNGAVYRSQRDAIYIRLLALLEGQ